MYVSVDVQEGESCQPLVAHSGPQRCLDPLESTEGPLGRTRCNWQGAENAQDGTNVGIVR